jgi:plastocyanin
MLPSSLNAPLIGHRHSPLTQGDIRQFGPPDALTPVANARQVMQISTRQAKFCVCASAGMLTLLAGVAWGALSPSPYHVSQKGRAFQPGELAIQRGETVQIVNDDGDLLHHAYLESNQFSFDSGDQEPGSKTDIIFPVSGTFTVLCGIHPKMKLIVRVN